jgi:hypothetical protein
MKKNKSEVREAEDEIDLPDDMLTSLVELLEEKGIITQAAPNALQRSVRFFPGRHIF